MRWQPPTVDTSALDSDRPGKQSSDGQPESGDGGPVGQRDHDYLVAELRFRLPAVEVRAPAVLPGGSTPNGLASVAESSGVEGSGLAGAIIRVVGMLWPNPVGTRSASGSSLPISRLPPAWEERMVMATHRIPAGE
jgi:hypothetical protein